MNRGASCSDNDSGAKKKEITKTLEELLIEVSTGEYEDFRLHVKQENNKRLYLTDRAVSVNLLQHLGYALQGTEIAHLHLNFNGIHDGSALINFGQSLKGTSVTHVDLGWNNIYFEDAKNFLKSLKDTHITHVNLEHNRINARFIKEFEIAIIGNQIIHIDITTYTDEEIYALEDFKKTLEANKRRLAISPYLTMNLPRLSEEKKHEHFNLDVLQHGTVEYAGGIIANLPPELVDKVVSFLPLMRGQVDKYRKRYEAFHKNEILVEQNITEFEMLAKATPCTLL